MVVPAAYKKAIQSLWTGLATITVRQGVLNPANGRTEPVEKVTASGPPASPTRPSRPPSPPRRRPWWPRR